MPTSNDTEANASGVKQEDDEQISDEIAQAARLAALAFDGRLLSDGELDEMCDAVLREAERKQTKRKKQSN